MKPDNTPLNADDKLHDAIYGIAELNIKNIESCEMMYAVRPFRLIKFVKKYELQARIDEARFIQREYFDGEEFHPNDLANHIRLLDSKLKQELEKL